MKVDGVLFNYYLKIFLIFVLQSRVRLYDSVVFNKYADNSND